jgi:hypothetical protein
MTTTTPAPAYPVTPPGDHDPRFTFGLLHDITAVLAAHGYPPVTAPADLVRWQQALFTTIYRQETQP